MPWINIVLKSPEGCSPTAGPADDSSFLLPHHHLLSPHGGQLGGGRSHSWRRRRNAGRRASTEPGPGIELAVYRADRCQGREGSVVLSHVLSAVLLDLGLAAPAHQRVVGDRAVGWRGFIASSSSSSYWGISWLRISWRCGIV